MHKKIILSLLVATGLFASTSNSIDFKVMNAEKRKLLSNPNIQVHNISIGFKKDLVEKWKGYVFNIDLTQKGRRYVEKDIIFSDGVVVTSSLIDINTDVNYKDKMFPLLSNDYYKEEYLIAGNKDAKNKIVVFSDPLCPICVRFIPKLINEVARNPKELSLYYIHFPLEMHPTAGVLSRAMVKATKDGVKNVASKVYTASFERFYDAYKNRDEQITLDAFNKVLGTNYLLKDVNTKEFNAEEKLHLELGSRVMVRGTPTIYFNGALDNSRSQHKKFMKN